MRSLAFLALSALAGLGSHAFAQTCTVPPTVGQEVHPVWGGETWGTFTLEVDGSHRIWTGEDGGRIRTSWDGGATWQFAATPADFASSVLDLWFTDDGATGYASARNGRALKTIDGGLSWDNLNGSTFLDDRGDPATIWGIRELPGGTLLMSGNWLLRISYDAGATWLPVKVFDRDPTWPGAVPIQVKGLRLFRPDTVGTSAAFAGSVGAVWEASIGGGWTGPSDFRDHSVVLHTNSTVAASNGGQIWWITLDDGTIPSDTTVPTLGEPTSVRFAADATSFSGSLGFAIGGPGGNAASKVYMTTNSGRSWTHVTDSPFTMYDVASRSNGDAMVVGYSGRYLKRNPVGGTWVEHTMPSSSDLQPTPYFHMAALEGVANFGTNGWVVVGDFGTQRITHDGGSNWASMSPFYPGNDELELRLFDVAFPETAPLRGCMVGQLGKVMYTSDGGCTWREAYADLHETMVAIDINSIGRGVAVGGVKGTLIHSSNGGLTWSPGTFVGGGSGPSQYADVAFADNNEVWAIGNTQRVAHSTDGGATWSLVPGPGITGLVYTDIAFASATEGVMLAQDGNGAQLAFRIDVGAGGPTWTALSLPPGIVLNDVAFSRDPLVDATGFAVGKEGSRGAILEWDGARFVTAVGAPNVAIELRDVDVDSTGTAALMGGVYDNDPADSTERGYLVRFDAASSWDKPRASCGKDITGICLTSPDGGYIAGQTLTPSASFINGNLASSILLRYLKD